MPTRPFSGGFNANYGISVGKYSYCRSTCFALRSTSLKAGKIPTTNLSKQGTQVTNSCFAPKYAKNEALAQLIVYQESIVIAE
jgi:hypothetical protein